MKSIIKKYWYLIALVIIIPILLNYTLPLSFVGNIIGGDNSTEVWLGFFGSYIGSIIGAVVTFIVLYFTIKSNKEENNKIRLYSELEQKQLICVDYIYSYSLEDIYNILLKWYNISDVPQNLKLNLTTIKNQHKKAWYKLKIVSNSDNDYFKQQNTNHKLFIELLDKIEFILSLRSYNIKYPNNDKTDYNKLSNKYPELSNYDEDNFPDIVIKPYDSISSEEIYNQSREYLTSLQNKIINNG